ncbi:hypothetical protein A225_0501 [Klebsiella michiganensis E718]|nr:hypothetical protein A225_0501 [Klebsiella michiganensis E718]
MFSRLLAQKQAWQLLLKLMFFSFFNPFAESIVLLMQEI